MRVILPLPEGDIVVGRTRAQQITAVIIQGIKYRCRVAIVQGVRVAVILSAQRGPSQGMDIGVAVITDDAGRPRRGRRFGANGTLLALNRTHKLAIYLGSKHKRYVSFKKNLCCVNPLDKIILV